MEVFLLVIYVDLLSKYYLLMIHLQDIFIFLPAISAIFWFILLILKKKKTKAQKILGVFIATETILYLCHAIFFSGNGNLYLKVDVLYNFVGLAVYPLYYIYVRLLSVDLKIEIKQFYHLIPAVLIALLLQSLLLQMNQEEKMHYLYNILWDREMPNMEKGGGKIFLASAIFFLGRILFGFQAVYYLIKSYFLTKKYDKNIGDFYSNLKGKNLLWLKRIIVIILCVSLVSFTVNILGRGCFIKEHNKLLFIPSLLFTIKIFWLGYLGYKYDYDIGVFEVDARECKTHYSKKQQTKLQILEKLSQTLDTDKLYLDSELNILKLTKKLYTNRTYLSNVINDEFGLNFNNYINYKRIEYAKKLILNDKDNRISLIEISENSGFGSFSSFNRAFKKFESTTAKLYREKHNSK